MRSLFLLLLVLLCLCVCSPVAIADYALPVQAITNSPPDAVTSYLGNRQAVPTTTVNISIQFIPTSGTINVVEIYDYSGTAGTAEAYSYYLRINNTTEYLINTTTLATSERVFTNSTLGISVNAGDFFEIKRVHPTWATNPLTNIVGGYVLITTTSNYGYALFGQGLTNSPADSVTNYLGILPNAPSATAGVSKIFIPTEGNLSKAYVNEYSGTAGTAEAYSYYVNINGTATLINTIAVAVSARFFDNSSLALPVYRGNYLEFKRIHPAWATNPLTNIVGGVAFVNTTETVGAHGYPIWVEALTSSPTDAQTVYFGNRPIAPSTTATTNKIYMRSPGVITRALIYGYAGTAGTAESWTMNVVKNNLSTYPISTVASGTNERIFLNRSLNIPVIAGDYFEIQSVQPTWATNPATSVYGGYLYKMYDGAPPVVSFTSNTTSGDSPLAVQFTDTSTTSITAWNWSAYNVENGTTLYFSTSANPVQTFNSGHWNVYLNVTNASSYSNTLGTYTISTNPTGGYTGFVQQDLWQDANYIQTFHFTNSETGLIVNNVTITVGSNDTYSTTNGTAYITLKGGIYLISFMSEGYNLRQTSFLIDEDKTHSIQLTPAVTPSSRQQNTWYNPHLVRFIAKDYAGQPVSDLTVYAQGQQSTASDNWILNLLGVDMTTTPMKNATLTGTTGSDGSIVFMMLESVQYKVNFTSAVKGVDEEVTLYPKEESYLVIVGTTAAGTAASNWGAGSASISRNLSANQSGTKLTFNLSYADPTSATTSIFFYIEDANRTPIYNTTQATNAYEFGYVIDPFVHGATYYYGYTAVSTVYGELSGNAIVTTHSRLLAPLEYLGWDTSWYIWITVICLICFAALFSGTTNVYGTLLLPFWSLFFGYIGWLDWCPWEFLVGVAILGTLAFISKMYARVSDG